MHHQAHSLPDEEEVEVEEVEVEEQDLLSPHVLQQRAILLQPMWPVCSI